MMKVIISHLCVLAEVCRKNVFYSVLFQLLRILKITLAMRFGICDVFAGRVFIYTFSLINANFMHSHMTCNVGTNQHP